MTGWRGKPQDREDYAKGYRYGYGAYWGEMHARSMHTCLSIVVLAVICGGCCGGCPFSHRPTTSPEDIEADRVTKEAEREFMEKRKAEQRTKK